VPKFQRNVLTLNSSTWTMEVPGLLWNITTIYQITRRHISEDGHLYPSILCEDWRKPWKGIRIAGLSVKDGTSDLPISRRIYNTQMPNYRPQHLDTGEWLASGFGCLNSRFQLFLYACELSCKFFRKCVIFIYLHLKQPFTDDGKNLQTWRKAYCLYDSPSTPQTALLQLKLCHVI